MPELDTSAKTKEYHLDTPQQNCGYFLKGSGSYDWGMKNRLARIFDPASGKTVMLAFDHGYFQGPTTGLERIDVTISPLAPYRRRAHVHPGRSAHAHQPRVPQRGGPARLAAGPPSSRTSPTSASRWTWRMPSDST